MSTPYQTVYDAFLSKVKEDDWGYSDDITTIEADWKSLLDSAILQIKFPRIELTQDTAGFVNTLGLYEIQLLATYMKVEWLSRSVLTWENIEAQYEESDFSQANLINQLNKLLRDTEARADKMQHNYYRSVNGRAYPYSNLAGDN